MGRMVANKGNGQCISAADPFTCAPAPLDIVLIPVPVGPPAPSPCVNTAQLSNAINVIDSVKVNGKSAVVRRSEIPQSSGAPPNATSGIKSPPPVNNKCNFIGASLTVFAGGYPIVRHRDLTAQNFANCFGRVKLQEAFSLHGSGITIDDNLTHAEKESVLQNLEALYERPRSKELLDTIRNDYQHRKASGGRPNEIKVSANKPNGTSCPASSAGQIPIGPDANEYNGIGNPSWIQYHPTQSLNVTGYAPSMSPELVLAHELVHALHSARGTTLSGTSSGVLPNGSAASPMNNWEQQAMGIGNESNARLAESRFAEERGMPVRRTHGPSEGFFPFNPSPASVAPVGFSSGAGGEKFVYCSK